MSIHKYYFKTKVMVSARLEDPTSLGQPKSKENVKHATDRAIGNNAPNLKIVNPFKSFL